MSRVLCYRTRLLSRQICSLKSSRISVCIVGSGPAGFYTAEKLLKAHKRAEVDIIDRLPTPFGLVRSGVAPDHPKTKVVINQFTRAAKSERCSFYGNITLGSDVFLHEIRENYDIVVLSYGAESDRSLGIPGEELNSIYSAREFVWWYNGHPDCCDLAPDLKSTDAAVILGLEALKDCRIQKRVYELISQAAASPHYHSPAEQKELHFLFFRKPDRFLPSENGCTVGALRLERTILKESGSSVNQVAVGTGEFEDISCRLVFKSIGYKSLPITGLPFDCDKGIVSNVKGRVLSSYQIGHEAVEHGLYVTGWLKRGPTGIVATNLYCAEETVSCISEDVEKGLLVSASGTRKAGRQGLLQLLEKKNIKFVDFSGWEKIDAKEKLLGEQSNKPREKITTWEELLKTSYD